MEERPAFPTYRFLGPAACAVWFAYVASQWRFEDRLAAGSTVAAVLATVGWAGMAFSVFRSHRRELAAWELAHAPISQNAD